jgi:hypothetical protein
MKLGKLPGACCALALLAIPQAHATDTPWEKGSLQLSAFITNSDTELRVDAAGGGLGAVVDVEDVLGLDSEKFTYRIDAIYRVGESRRHQFDLHYYDSRRSATKVIDRAITVGDVTFPINAQVDTRFDLQFINLDYSYAFLQDDRVRVSAAVGLHSTGIKLKLDEVGGTNAFEERSFTAPLPVLGLRGEVMLTPRWRFKGGVDAFYLEYDEVTGSLTDISLAVEYLPFKNVGFGVGVNSVKMHVSAEGETDIGVDLNGELKFDFTGALLYAKLFF